MGGGEFGNGAERPFGGVAFGPLDREHGVVVLAADVDAGELGLADVA